MKNQDQTSVVASRLSFLIGKTVNVHLQNMQPLLENRVFQAIYHDCIQAGRAYFFHFITGKDKSVLIQTDEVSKIEEEL